MGNSPRFGKPFFQLPFGGSSPLAPASQSGLKPGFSADRRREPPSVWPVADDVRAWEVEPCHSSGEAGEQSTTGFGYCGGVGGAKGRGQGPRGMRTSLHPPAGRAFAIEASLQGHRRLRRSGPESASAMRHHARSQPAGLRVLQILRSRVRAPSPSKRSMAGTTVLCRTQRLSISDAVLAAQAK